MPTEGIYKCQTQQVLLRPGKRMRKVGIGIGFELVCEGLPVIVSPEHESICLNIGLQGVYESWYLTFIVLVAQLYQGSSLNLGRGGGEEIICVREGSNDGQVNADEECCRHSPRRLMYWHLPRRRMLRPDKRRVGQGWGSIVSRSRRKWSSR